MAALEPGQLLLGTPYRVVRRIGEGGMGVVYEVEHVRLGKAYVAKVISDSIKDAPEAIKRMDREGRVLAAIDHPNIVQVHDVGRTPEGASYFVMEKLAGVDLRVFMKVEGPVRRRALEIVADVLDALDYVHARGIVHRDIKPENIFLSEQAKGTVTKVLDFGVAHVLDGDGRLSHGRITRGGGFVGTLYYAAPEQMQGMPAAPPNDVYAAALVLFELVAGHGPFDADPGVGLSRCFKPAPALAEQAGAIPPALSALVARALALDPLARPTAAAFAAELRALVRELATADVTDGAIDAVHADVDDLLRGMPRVTPPPPALPPSRTSPIASPAAPPVSPPPETSPGVYSTRSGPPTQSLVAPLAAGAILLLGVAGAVGLLVHRAPPTPAPAASGPPAALASSIALAPSTVPSPPSSLPSFPSIPSLPSPPATSAETAATASAAPAKKSPPPAPPPAGRKPTGRAEQDGYLKDL